MNRLRQAYGDNAWKEYRKSYHRNGYDALPKYSRFHFVILICGVYDGKNCARDGQGNDPLAPYRKWAQENGYQVLTFDVDDYVDNLETNPKNDNAKLPLFDDLKPYLDLPVNILLIGHSAGGDIAIRASEYLIDTGNDYRLGGTVLLDPFMYYPGKDLAQIADGIAAEHPVFLADTAQDYILVDIPHAVTPSQDSGLRFDTINSGKLDYTHAEIATSVDVAD